MSMRAASVFGPVSKRDGGDGGDVGKRIRKLRWLVECVAAQMRSANMDNSSLSVWRAPTHTPCPSPQHPGRAFVMRSF